MNNKNNKITKDNKVITRKQALDNPELQKQIEENNAINPFSRKPKLNRTPPKQNTKLIDITQLPSTSKTNTEFGIDHLFNDTKTLPIASKPILQTKVDDLLKVPETNVAPTSPNEFFSPNPETPTNVNDSIFDFEDKQHDYTDIGGILNEQSLILDKNKVKINNLTNQDLIDFNNSTTMSLKLPLKEVAKLVPEFDGENTPVDEYIEKLQEVKDIIADTDEENLVHILKIKLKGLIRKALKNSDIKKIDQLISAIRTIYPCTENIHTLYGKLTQITQKDNESILKYTSRLKDLAIQIKEIKKLSPNITVETLKTFTDQLNEDAFESFKNGLNDEIRMKLGEPEDLEAAIKKAITIEANNIKQKSLRNEEVKVLFNAEKIETNLPRIFSCQICRDKNHEAFFCIAASCVYCKSKDHISYYCINAKNKMGLICKYCNAQGHSIDACKLNQTNGNHCQYCQVIGHSAVQCPIISDYEICWKCKETGHDPNMCRKTESNADSCEACGNLGHSVKNCPSVICRRCNKLGHSMKYCNVTKKMIWCAICNDEGHEASDCENAKVLVMQNKQTFATNKVTCQLCNKVGHSAKSCQQIINNTNRYNQNPNRGYNKYSGNKDGFLRNYQRNIQPQQANFQSVNCEYCKLVGHTIEKCRRLQKLEMQLKCAYCKEMGHLIDDCYKLKALENKAEKFCNFCKLNNHSDDECFKKQNYQIGNSGNE